MGLNCVTVNPCWTEPFIYNDLPGCCVRQLTFATFSLAHNEGLPVTGKGS